MKFSILIPTRDRLEYLRYAIESVRRQDYDNWEVVVYDNCSSENVAAYVETLREPRIRYFRTSESVPVTENWNNALRESTGDYVIMLGDDDCLMKGYFSTMVDLVERFSQPDMIYTSAWLYAYPDVMPDAPRGFLEPYGYARVLRGVTEAYELEHTKAVALVREALKFRVRVAFNMQFVTVRKEFIRSLEPAGPFYQSPFPDYYAMNAIFLEARRIVVCPRPVVTVGITRKSYGYFHFNLQEDQGARFLMNLPNDEAKERFRRVLLPGTLINTNWLLAMEALCVSYGRKYGLRISYWRYRILQVLYCLKACYVQGMMNDEQLREMKRLLSVPERIACEAWESLMYGKGRAVLRLLSKFVKREWLTKLNMRFEPLQFPAWYPSRIEGKYANILEVFENVDSTEGFQE